MFKVGDEVVTTNGDLGTVILVSHSAAQVRYKSSVVDVVKLTELKPRFEVKYVVVDNSDRGEKSPIFKTEQQAFDYINKPRVNVGERWKHSDGTIVTVDELNNLNVYLKVKAINVEFSITRSIETFLQEFTKCE